MSYSKYFTSENEPEKYEQFIRHLIVDMSKSDREITQIQQGRGNKIRGKSGLPHQIDVSFIDKTRDSTLVLIECKRKKLEKTNGAPNTVTLEEILVALARREDIYGTGEWKNIESILVSTVRLTNGAKVLADGQGIKFEFVEHHYNYCFNYDNITQTGEHVVIGDKVEAEVILKSNQ